jgi:hypothetical protein
MFSSVHLIHKNEDYFNRKDSYSLKNKCTETRLERRKGNIRYPIAGDLTRRIGITIGTTDGTKEGFNTSTDQRTPMAAPSKLLSQRRLKYAEKNPHHLHFQQIHLPKPAGLDDFYSAQ